MVILDRFKDAGPQARVSLVVLLVAALFAWIAYTCPGWGGYPRKTEPYERSGRHIGLWRSCSDDKYHPSCTRLDGWALEWFMTFQALITFGFLGTNLGFFLVVLYIFIPSCQRQGELGKVAAIVNCGAAGLFMTGVILFGVRYRRDYIDKLEEDFVFGYCFFLSIIAFLLDGVSGLLMFLDSRWNGRLSTETKQLTGHTFQANPTYGVNVSPDGQRELVGKQLVGKPVSTYTEQTPSHYKGPTNSQEPANFQASEMSSKQEA